MNGAVGNKDERGGRGGRTARQREGLRRRDMGDKAGGKTFPEADLPLDLRPVLLGQQRLDLGGAQAVQSRLVGEPWSGVGSCRCVCAARPEGSSRSSRVLPAMMSGFVTASASLTDNLQLDSHRMTSGAPCGSISACERGWVHLAVSQRVGFIWL
jgi:hypothetical protein